MPVPLKFEPSETAGAAHGAVIAGLAAWFDAANFLFFKEVYEFRDRRFFDAEFFLTWMRVRGVYAGQPWRVSDQYWLRLGMRIKCCGTRTSTS